VLSVEVADGGVGMSAEQVSRAFIPFEQVDKGSEGAGLGLAIVNRLVSLMDGTIAIDSEPGRGTRVSVVLPFEAAAQDMAALMSSESGMPCGLRQGRPRLLVVDDNQTNVQFLVDLLQMVGFEVRSASGVTEGLALHAAQPFDLIITDLLMPERDGFDLIQSVRGGTHAPQTPIIVASASAFPGDQVRSTAAGANAFVPKPVESLALLQKIAGLLQLEYVYQGEAGEAQPAPSSAPAADVLRAAVQQGDGQRVVEAIRSAAELGQMPRVEALIAEVADAALQRALRDALATGLKEQDSELVLDGLMQALGDTPR